MIFEGSEKKAEIVFSNVNLFQKEDQYWAEVVEKCEAKILSSVKTKQLKSYLLSESSLFVWEDRVLLITCGTTTLVHAVEKLTKDFGIENVENLIFQRKNEYCGQMQKTNFFDDKKLLDQLHNGTGLRLGNYDGHHLFLFHLNRPFQPQPDDTTCEVLTYELSDAAVQFLTTKNLPNEKIREYFQFEKYFPSFLLDDFVFDPFGYSINGICKDDYFTIHITPEDCHSYVSFETSLPLETIETGFLAHLLNILGPESFDLIRYSPIELKKASIKDFTEKKHIMTQIECGYHLEFTHFYDSTRTLSHPVKL